MFEILRQAAAGATRPPGLESMQVARRMGDLGNELVAITVWTDLGSIEAAFGSGFLRPSFLPALEPHLEGATLEHFETVVDRFEDLADVG